MESVFFHGTSYDAAKKILEEGFRTRLPPDPEVPELGPLVSGGHLGDGIYLSCRWATALWFGNVLFRASLKPGTRVLDTSIPANPRTIEYLKREFGKQILHKPAWKVLPENKRLKDTELIELFRYTYNRVWSPRIWRPKNIYTQDRALSQYRSMLVRHGYHAYGDPRSDNGIVVFADDRIVVEELVGVLPSHLSGFPLDAPPFKDLEAFRRAAIPLP